MQSQLIQNFLNLPGIVGLSLMPLKQTDALSLPHSAGFSQGNNPSQQPLLVQGIQQIIGTTPSSLEFCSFQFGQHRVDLYRLERQSVLLVFSQSQLTDKYPKAVSELIQFAKADYSALATGMEAINDKAVKHVSLLNNQSQAASVGQLLGAMNSLSQVTSRYLGKQLVVNQWRTCQQLDIIWIDNFHIATDGTIGLTNRDPDQDVSPEQLTAARLWVQEFHQNCTKIIRDYDSLIEQTLPERHWQLLFGN